MLVRAKISQGFTIVELMIASTIFTSILVLATTAVIAVGRNYQKGITISRSQNATNRVLDDIIRAITVSAVDPVNGGNSLCIGTIRYTMFLDQNVTEDGVHGLWKDEFGSGPCNPITQVELDAGAPGEEMIPVGMRLRNLSATQQGTLWNIRISIVSGPLDLIDPASNTCLSTRQGGQYCNVTDVNALVSRRNYL